MNQKQLRVLGTLLIGSVLVLLSLNPVLESILNGYLQNKVRFQQESSTFRISYESLGLNVFTQELRLENLKVRAVSNTDSLQKEPDRNLLSELDMGTATLEGINLANFLWDRSLEIHSIALDSLGLTFLRPTNPVTREKGEEDRPILDALQLPGINAIQLGEVSLAHFTLNILKEKSRDTVTSFLSSDLRINGVGLREIGTGRSHTFVPILEEMALRLGEQQYVFGQGIYSVAYDSLVYVHKAENLRMKNLRILPQLPVDSFAARNPGKNFQRIEMGIGRLSVEGLGLRRILRTGALWLQKIELDSFAANIYKDGAHPINPNRNIPLPSRILEDLDFSLSVDTFRIRGPRLSYYEKMPNRDQHLETFLTEIAGEIRNVRSANWALDSEAPLQIDFGAELLDAIPVVLELELPYGKDAIFVKGHTAGTSDLASLNPTTLPAINLRFGGGRLNGMEFHARGNSHQLEGELTMLYTDLDVQLFRPDRREQYTLSWVANAIVKSSNPNRRGHTLVADIYAERDPTKGVIGYVMKGISSGIANTFNPLGKSHRE